MSLIKVNWDAIILVGGKGTRLKSISNGLPKSLMPIGEKVYLDLIIEKLISFGIKNIYLSLCYKSDLFRKYINSSKYKLNLHPIIESVPLDTGGAIKNVLKKSKIKSPFFAMNGDTLSNINFLDMMKKFKEKKYKAMIGISKVQNGNRYGTVNTDRQNIVSFDEKTRSGSGWVNNGYYIITKEALDGFEGSFSLEKDIFPELTKNNEIGAFKVFNDDFIDMGIPEDYYKLCNMIRNKN